MSVEDTIREMAPYLISTEKEYMNGYRLSDDALRGRYALIKKYPKFHIYIRQDMDRVITVDPKRILNNGAFEWEVQFSLLLRWGDYDEHMNRVLVASNDMKNFRNPK